MLSLLTKWRFFNLGKEEYKKCMEKTFVHNLYSLFQANIIVIITACSFTVYPFFVEKNLFKTSIQMACAVFAGILSVFVHFKINQYEKKKQVSNRSIYAMILIYYINVIGFGIYLGVFANPGRLAVSFMGILICALFLFNISPILNLCLTVSALALFITATVLVKLPNEWSFDVVNSLFAGCICQFFGWQITMFRISLASTAGKMEAERNSYYNQSTVDELTQLKNRRDFMQTFQRFLFSHRQSDNFLCVAMLDIDFFKKYNDYYGHLQGDDCLRAIGKALGSMDSMGIYSARIGGEEFALIWFENEIANAYYVASRVNQMIRDLDIPHVRSKVAPRVTISIGIHIAKCGAYKDTQPLYDLADKALYAAKSDGRDRSVITSDFLN